MMMVGAQFGIPTVSGIGTVTAQANRTLSILLSPRINFASLKSPPIQLGFRNTRFCGSRSLLIRSDSSRSSRSSSGDYHDHDFLQASLLLSETISHYRMWRWWGLQKELKRKSSALSMQRTDIETIEQGFLYRVRSPAIFLKISCNGDYVLPIIVGESAIERLADSKWDHENEDFPDQFQFVRNLVDRLGHEVIRVRITERVMNTYIARIDLIKPGKSGIFSVDARPSDAINVANRCQAPIYVSRQIVLTDAVRIGYGMGRVREKRPTYDVSLDSPIDGPDMVAEELDMLKNMHAAVEEQRFEDAAMWRDKLEHLRQSRHEPS